MAKIRLFALCFVLVALCSVESYSNPQPDRKPTNPGHDLLAIINSSFQPLTSLMDRVEDSIKSAAQSSEESIEESDDDDADDDDDDDDDGPYGSSGVSVSSHHSPFLFSLPGMKFSFNQEPMWTEGPNVCVEREEIDETPKDSDSSKPKDVLFGIASNFDHFGSTMSSCSASPNKFECTTKVRKNGVVKTFIERYQCCHGTKRLRNAPGCTEKTNKNVLEMGVDLGGSMFEKLVQSSGLRSTFETPENRTIFVPTDEALRDYIEELKDDNEVRKVRRDIPDSSMSRAARAAWLRNAIHANETQSDEGFGDWVKKEMILSHQVKGLVNVRESNSGQVLESMLNGYTIRLNVYPTGVWDRIYTANCAKISKMDHEAVNGMVHMVDRVLEPISKKDTIASIVQSRPEFSTLRSLFEANDMMKLLQEKDDITLLAPTNEAFKNIDPELLKRYMAGEGCVEAVLKNHILPDAVCSAGVEYLIGRNLKGSFTTLKRVPNSNGVDTLLIDNKIEVTRKDVLASNGVIQVIGEVMIPDEAIPVSQWLKSNNLTRWVELIERAGLTHKLDNSDDMTLLVPTDKALDLPEGEMTLTTSSLTSEEVRDSLKYYIGHPALDDDDLENGMQIQTEVEGQNLRVLKRSAGPILPISISGSITTVQCARISPIRSGTCGASIYRVGKALLPPSGSISDLLQREEFSILREIIRGSSFEKVLNSSEDNRFITFLAPTNAAFERVSPEALETMSKEDFLKRHIIPTPVCCSSLTLDQWPFINSVNTLKERFSLVVGRGLDNSFHFGRAKALRCDNMATNGIMHSIDKPLGPSEILKKPEFTKFKMASPFDPSVDIVVVQ